MMTARSSTATSCRGGGDEDREIGRKGRVGLREQLTSNALLTRYKSFSAAAAVSGSLSLVS